MQQICAVVHNFPDVYRYVQVRSVREGPEQV